MKLSRRSFVEKIFQGVTAIPFLSLIITFLESCGNSNPSAPASSSGPTTPTSGSFQTIHTTVNNGKIVLSIDSSSSLANVGGAAFVDYQSGSILVDRTNSDAFNALSSTCTHQGCTITSFDPSTKQFICPCHGSQYNLNGQVVVGPAKASLTAFQNSFSNNQLLIDLNSVLT